MAQMNPVVGDITGNARKVLAWTEKAKKAGAHLVLFPELTITGYPPEDLLLKPGFIEDNLKALKSLARKINGITAVIGFVDRGVDIYNAAAIVHKGRVCGVYHKMYLPNYGVFDEQRYFQAGDRPLNFILLPCAMPCSSGKLSSFYAMASESKSGTLEQHRHCRDRRIQF